MSQIKRLLQKHRDELAQVEREYQAKRDKLVFFIETLEKAISETVPKRRGRRKTGESVADLAAKILDLRPEGMPVPSLLGELKKLGYQTGAKNPINSVNSLLHRAGKPFVRLDDGRWILEKHQKESETIKGPGSSHVSIILDSNTVAKFPALLIGLLADGKGHDETELAREAEKRGWDFKGKRPTASVHGGLLNVAKRGLVEAREGLWYKRGDVAIGAARNGNEQEEESSKAPIH